MALKLVITGVAGRMGQALVRAAHAGGHSVVAAVERPGCLAVGRDVGAVVGTGVLGADVFERFEQALTYGPQVAIDFTTPDASLRHARLCSEAKVPIVIGTTGLSAQQKGELSRFAARVPMVVAPNMSVGVNVVIGVAGQLARVLGESFDVEIVETHHKHKKDAPSGTALELAKAVAAALGRTEQDFCASREGQVGERPHGQIGLQSVRGGDVVGEHTVFFFGEGERVELSHRATSREQFATGALRAAQWVVGRPPGLYDMRHVLGFAAP